ncbi:MAG: hypothetical protein V3R99_13735, partial [Thermoguttaceae bacterium]
GTARDRSGSQSDRPGESPGQTGQPQKSDASSGKEDRQPGDSDGMDRGQLEQFQRDIVYDAHDVQETMKDIDGLTDLTHTRMDKATKKAEQVSGAMARGNTEEASAAAKEAGALFAELARHVEGLMARQTADRIARARDMAGQLAQRERALGEAVPGNKASETPPPSPSKGDQGDQPGQGKDQRGEEGQGGQGKDKARGEGESGGEGQKSGQGHGTGPGHGMSDEDLLDLATRTAEGGRTLKDLLDALANADGESGRETPNRETADQIEQLLREDDVAAIVGRMQGLAARLRSGRENPGGSGRGLSTRDLDEANRLADRLGALAQRLDSLHRQVVAPQLEALLAMERRAAALHEKLTKLETQTGISDWHREADLLVQDLEKQSGGQPAEKLLDAMQGEGWTEANFGGWQWNRSDGSIYYHAPGTYVGHLEAIIEQLQDQARELLLRDLIASDDEATPPSYKAMVERYFKVLSQDSHAATVSADRIESDRSPRD